MTVLDRDLPKSGLQLSLADTPGRLDRLIAEAHEHIDLAMAMWLPGLAGYLRDLQDRVRAEAARQDWDIDPQRLTWGWWNKGGKCLTGACNV